MTNASAHAAADDTSETTDEEYLAKYGQKHARLGLADRSNPFIHGSPPGITRPEALRAIGEVLYAVRMPDGLVKIGWTTNLQLRLINQSLRGATLLAIKPGTYADEQAVHDSLSSCVHHGREWYWPTTAVLHLINCWRRALSLSPLDLSQFAAPQPASEQSMFGRGAGGRFERIPV